MGYHILWDAQRCSGCYACIVACMDQHDLDVYDQEGFWRRIVPLESGLFPQAAIQYLSVACRHCRKPACMEVCPAEAVYKDLKTGSVLVSQELCVGCRSCALACPFNAPYFGSDGRMEKCDMCSERVSYGLAPACVHTCPTRALTFTETDEENRRIEELLKK